jgi:predicted lipid-binding transport protein (Tim44 family)
VLVTLAVGGWLAVLNFAADISGSANLLLNLLTILIAVGVAIPAVKSRRKDATIKDLTEALDAKDKRVKTLAEELKDRTQQVRQIEQAAQHCTTEAAKWQAKYEEAKQYTAAEAVQQFEAALQAHSARVSERHEVLIQQGEATARSLGSIADVLARIESRTAPPQ